MIQSLEGRTLLAGNPTLASFLSQPPAIQWSVGHMAAPPGAGANPASGPTSTGAANSLPGADAGSGSGSMNTSSAPLPAGLDEDVQFISQNATLSFQIMDWDLLVMGGGTIDGNAPWDGQSDTSPHEPIHHTTTYDSGGVSTTTVHNHTQTVSYGEGGWNTIVVSQTDYTATSTGVDASGREFIQVTSWVHDRTWKRSLDSSWNSVYEVKQDVTETYTEDVTSGSGGSYSRHQGSSVKSRLTAEGMETNANEVSGEFTYKVDQKRDFSLSDSADSSNAAGLGYSVDYSITAESIYDSSGLIVPDGSNQGTNTIDRSATGEIVLKDAANGFLGFSLKDGSNVKSTYKGGDSSSPPPSTTGTINAGGPTTELAVPTGKHVVTVIDKGDRGWFSWPPEAREAYARLHNFDPKKVPDGNVADGEDFLLGMAPQGSYVLGNSARQVNDDLITLVGKFGPIDVLVFTDHGGPGVQELGNDRLTLADPRLLNMLVAHIKKPGGTLVVAGCEVFGSQPAIEGWQAYATAHGITIMGSASDVTYAPSDVQGVWITLVPGGTPPTVIFPPKP